MGVQFAEFVSRILPLTVGDGKPEYRAPFISSSNPSQELSNLVANTQKVYQVNPYITEPSHAIDTKG